MKNQWIYEPWRWLQAVPLAALLAGPLAGPAMGQPVILDLNPEAGAVVAEISFINVTFDIGVTGIDRTDLLINGVAATNMVFNSSREYTFYFAQPAVGTVQVAWAANHGITDTTEATNAFAGGNWTYTLDPTSGPKPTAVISEFMADNQHGIKDEDGQRNDWVELLNPTLIDANLEGWFLTDTATNLTKWRLPGVALRPGAYTYIWCSSKDRSNLNAPLHTNFKLQKEAGGFLALVDPQTNVISTFVYPVQSADVSYGRVAADQNAVGYFTTPTPGAQNSSSGPGILIEPIFSFDSGVYTDASLMLVLSNANGVGTIRYTTNATLPASNSIAYTGPITLGINSTIKARVFPPNNSSLLPSAVVSRNYVFLDGTAANFSSRLPLLIISTDGRSIPSDVPPGAPRAKGSITLIDTVRGRSSIQGNADVHELAEFEVFGQTSAGFAKMPIRMEIQDAFGNDLDKSLLGMPADSDWRLRNPYNDKTLLNDYLGFELWEKMGHYSVRRKFVEVFRDVNGGRLTYPGDYYGVMVLAETIKVNNDRVNIKNITPYTTNLAVTDGGFIFKRDKDSGGDLNFTSPGSPGGAGNVPGSGIPLKLHEPKVQSMRKVPLTSGSSSFPGAGYTPSASNQLSYLRSFMGAMERAMYTNNWLTQTGTNHYSYYLDPVAFADQMLHVEFTKQIDGYRLSDYFNKGNDGRIGPGPVWDWNLAYGNADYLAGGQTNGWYYEAAGETDHPWARRLITGSSSSTGTTGDPNFTQLVADRWAMFRTNVLNATNTMKEIDQLSALLSEAAARDLYGKYRAGLIGVYTWPNPGGSADGRDVDYVHPTNYLGPIEFSAPTNVNGSIIGQMKKWVLGRYLWIDSQFVPVPNFSRPPGMVSAGTVVTLTPPPGGVVYYTLDGTDPRASGGTVAAGAQSSSNAPVNLTVNANVRVFARARRTGSWKSTWSGPNISSYYPNVPPLRITEVMFHPAPPPPGLATNADNFEYIEVKNVSGASLNLAGYSLSGGIQFAFGNTTLNAGQAAVVVKDLAAFASRYNTNGMVIAGVYTGSLANDGDHVLLLGPLGEVIHDFTYSDSWYRITDGTGFALVPVDENGPLTNWNNASGWRPGSALGGSPGQTDPSAPPRPPVVINEALTHTDTNVVAGQVDVIELYNPTASPADISGWFLTDDFGTPKKFVIPAGTIIGPNSYKTFSEHDFNVGPNAFALSSQGDEIYLFSGNGTDLTGYSHGFDFGPAPQGETLGRYVISTGEDHFVAQASSTLGTNNSGPKVGPVVIGEINYQPSPYVANGAGFDNPDDEYIELHNITGNPVKLFDEAHPTNTWHLRDAVSFDFPQGVTLPANSYLIAVGFDPTANAAATAAFRLRNFIPDNVPLYGPWSGELDNTADSVELRRPDVPLTNDVPYILVERVKYSNGNPWPVGGAGLGLTIQRIVANSYGNDPTNWVSAAPTPGGEFTGGTAPAIVSQPGDQLLVTGRSTELTAQATGTPPLRYQWYFNGLPLNGAFNSTLLLSNVQPSQAGVYNIFVYNGGGSVLGTNFTISTRTGLQITAQPTNRITQIGLNTNFIVQAIGSGRLRYQWSFNDAQIANATNNVYTVSNVQSNNVGSYSVRISDDFDSTNSQTVTLSLIFKPIITVQPLDVTVVSNGTATFSIAASGTPPISFRWRKNNITVSNPTVAAGPTNATLILAHVTAADAATYNVAVTNIAGQASALSSNAVLTVLADSDGDGIPDELEPLDGAADTDGDGMTNAEEYFAGTDPLNPASYLKIGFAPTSSSTLTFNAVSNRTYSVQYSDGLNPIQWKRLGDVPAGKTTRVETMVDPSGNANRFYRLVTPTQP
jgi:hypothetical protein